MKRGGVEDRPGWRSIKKALISVSDKTNLEVLGRGLTARHIAMISTGGTASALEKCGCPVTFVENVTEMPEMLDGRVKTLHPRVHGALLAIRDREEHQKAMHRHGIEPIDLLVVNLYPFEQTAATVGVPLEHVIENIDIGGPAMIRSAAKNHRDVVVLTDPSEYEEFFRELETHAGCTTQEYRRAQMVRAFSRTAAYDRVIATYFRKKYRKELKKHRVPAA